MVLEMAGRLILLEAEKSPFLFHASTVGRSSSVPSLDTVGCEGLSVLWQSTLNFYKVIQILEEASAHSFPIFCA